MDTEVNGSAPSTAQVRVRLNTRDADISLPEGTGPILVPTNLRRYALSTVVNQLLDLPKPIPLEFLINGEYLRTSLDEYLTAHGVSAETTLEVEYARALIPPLHIASFLHDDWVSSVDVLPAPDLASARVLSASYDGLLRVWNSSAQVVAVSPSASQGGHTASIKAAKFVSPTQIVSSGLDRTVRLWKYTPDSAITPHLDLLGHTGSVDAVHAHAPSRRILSASTDHAVGLWSTSKSEAPPAPDSATAPASKRRKLHAASSTPSRGPLAMLRAHTAPVAEAVFDASDATVGYSASWDHTLRTWDLVTGALVDTRSAAHALLCAAHLPTLRLVAAGSAARNVVMVDPRVGAAQVAAMTLRGHTNKVVSVAGEPGSAYGLVSGSHDGTCRIWDLRSTRAEKEGVVAESVYTIPRKSVEGSGRRVGGEGVKVFSVCWDKTVGILSAGEDKAIQINRGEEILKNAA